MTSTEARYDIHRAASEGFDPANYRLIGVLDLATGYGRADDSKGRRAVAHMVAEGFKFARVHPSGQCDHCGNRLRYVAVMLHAASDGMIEIGMDCLGNRFSTTQAEVKRMMAEAKAAREAHKILDAFNEACAENQALAYATYTQNILVAAPEGTFSDFAISMLMKIARQARHYGSIAPWHLDRLETLTGELEAQLIRKEAYLAAQELLRSGRPATGSWIGEPKQRMSFTGEVRKIVGFDTAYGWKLLITIDTADGVVLWGTTSATQLEEGDKVSFVATVKEHSEFRGERQTVVLRPKFV
jgi:hypothetical protein